jgi:transposase-like protein
MDARTRLGWVRLYEQLGNAGVVCRRCGISRPTLRKWWRRYQAGGEAGLETRSHRPHRSPGRKVFDEQEALILHLRRERKLGIKRLRNELARRHELKLALDTIHKVLVRHGENRLRRPRLIREGTRRYSRPVPGDRVQMDTCKIRPGLYQYTAIDDCSRWQVIGLYPRRTAANTRDFLKHVLEEMPFPVHKAIAYATRRWEALTRFMTDGRICLSNNAAERTLRGVAVGRRNWTFAGSDRGGERAAAIYTLIESAKLNGIDPQAWLADVLARIADHPAKRVADLLPWSWRAERLAAAVEP